MSSLPPDENKNLKKQYPESFGEIMKTMGDFFNEKPIRGFLQSIDDLFKTPFPSGQSFHVETSESKDEYIISAELPGIKKDQIHLNVVGNFITISIENQMVETEEDDRSQVFRRKLTRHQSSRTISLPQPINEKRIKASYRDGLLKIRIPIEKGNIITLED